MTDRKLFRPNVNQYRNRPRDPQPEKIIKDGDAYRETSPPSQSSPSASSNQPPRRRQVPPEQTSAESFYYLKQMNSKTQVVVVLLDGEEIHGWIEWYDKDCIKVHCHNEQNFMLFKHSIKYITKERQG
jgi:host factor-I protein